MLKNVDGRTDGQTDGRTDDGVIGILIAHLGAFGSGELIKRNDWLLADTCLQAANHCALF